MEAGRGSHVSAASGLVKVGDRTFLIADDELSLFSFRDADEYVTPHALLPGKLPADPKARKKAKPDFESLLALTPNQWPPYGALVAWPSASKPNRIQAIVVPFAAGDAQDKPIVVSIDPLRKLMEKDAGELNLEGLAIQNGMLQLFQRGNSQDGRNGYFELPLIAWLHGLKKGEWKVKPSFQKVKMGELKGIPLAFADAVTTKYGVLSVASAEASKNAYDDGELGGSALLWVRGKEAITIGVFDRVVKLEGLHATETDKGFELLLVEDADDPARPSRLFRAQVPVELFRTTP
ncbi:MAG: hypothetical protein AB7P04_03565 [Bacteriovoracia bacterium]